MFTLHVHVHYCYTCRCGMVYVDPGELRWKPYVQTWLDHKFSATITDATKVHYTHVHYTHLHGYTK